MIRFHGPSLGPNGVLIRHHGINSFLVAPVVVGPSLGCQSTTQDLQISTHANGTNIALTQTHA